VQVFRALLADKLPLGKVQIPSIKEGTGNPPDWRFE
jgi:hypothetical protein